MAFYTKEELVQRRKKTMENNEKKYYNNSQLIGAERGLVGGAQHKVLKLRFTAWDRTAKEQVTRYFTMFLTKENNERNRDTLQALGVTNVPGAVTFEAVQQLEGLGTRAVDLVETTNEAGYQNIKFVNPAKFGVKVFEMRPKQGSSSANPF